MAVTDRLSISVVTYAPDTAALEATLRTVRDEAASLVGAGEVAAVDLFIVDNGPGSEWRARLESLLGRLQASTAFGAVRVLSGHGNVGFGHGHNLAIFDSAADFHLILNPDVELHPGSLEAAVQFMRAHPDVALLSPSAVWPDNQKQYLCKRYPTVLDLFVRGFLPARLRAPFARRLAAYELRHLQSDTVTEVPIVSGCFMLVRRAILADIGGFSPKYFMYFEDFDLSLRLGRLGRLVYHPGVRIVHAGGHASRKGLRHVRMFCKSALTFFGTHGWRFY
jgi:GT2 family glycosyltransferase